MDTLTLLTQREQLMEDIDSIIESQIRGNVLQVEQSELIKLLCDAVCENFPLK